MDQRTQRRLGVVPGAVATAFMSPALLLGLIAAASIVAQSPAEADDAGKPALAAYPPEIRLTGSSDRQSWIAVATRPDGITTDVTDEAQASLSDAELARLEGNVLYPTADGTTELAIAWKGQTLKIPVTVSGAAEAASTSFELDVMPVFMRAGCNTGACHGAARGKDGFRLSLFGFDPEGDYFRLTREVPFRRVNLARPGESLLLKKATGQVPHTGGKRFDVESPYYQTLLNWLESGAVVDQGEVPKVTGIELYPPQMVLEGEAATQRMIVCATYSDGTDRDVTGLSVFLSNNDNSAPVDENGVVTAAKRGEAFILARYDTKTVGSQVIVLPAGAEYVAPKEPPANYVDEMVEAKLKKLRIQPSPICDDPTFLRRATIDITGRLPTEEEFAGFTNDKDPNKRSKLIERLLNRKEFAEIWAMKWAELLMVKSDNQVSYKSAYLYSNWLTEQISGEVPIDDMAAEILAANGGTFSNPETNFYQINRDTLVTAENVAQVFMGCRIQCAQCHNHPFDRWTMDDYYSFAAFFSQIGRKQAEDYRETIIYDRSSGEVRHPVGNRVMKPKFLGGPEPEIQSGQDRREVLAAWLTSADNPYFASSVANRVWAYFFGIGIVEPVDDVRVSNPPSNPELLDTLGRKLTEYQFDLKRLVRDICNSNAYQRSSHPNQSNASDERNFARAQLRRIRAEVLLDCISQVTGTKDKFRGLPLGARAVQIADGTTSTYFLTTFGRSPRETVCACEVDTKPTLSQALHLINGDTIEKKISSGGVVKQLLGENNSPEQVVESLFLRCVARRPTPSEANKIGAALQQHQDKPLEVLEDVFWALLNSREFIFNH